MLRFHNVSKRYPSGHTALRDVSLEIGKGELVVLHQGRLIEAGIPVQKPSKPT